MYVFTGRMPQSLATQLFEDEGIEFYGVPRRNMQNKLMWLNDKLLSRKRSIIETIIDQLKNAVRARRVSRRKKRNKTISQIVGEAYRRYTFSSS